jgi:GMP synthase PP-ATPase subunit
VNDIALEHGLDGYVLPFKTIGIKGDNRAFEHTAVLAGMGEWDEIRSASKALAERLPITRTIYLWDEDDTNFSKDDFRGIRPLDFMENLGTLKIATHYAEEVADSYNVRYAQMPVIAHPGVGGMWITIRDVDTTDFRSLRPLDKPDEMSWECCDEIAKAIGSLPGNPRVCFDASTKPAATTEFV